MINIKLLEKIASRCGIGMYDAEEGKGGFVIDDTGEILESIIDIVMNKFYDEMSISVGINQAMVFENSGTILQAA